MTMLPSETVAPRRAFRWLALSGLLLVLAAVMWALARGHPDNKEKTDEPLATGLAVPEGPAWFRDMTAGSGIDFTYRNGEEADLYWFIESLGGGVAMIDYDGDGLLDLFFTGGGAFEGGKIKGRPCRLYRNLGNWKFRDVTAEVGLERINFYTHGCAVADYDKDGWPDLVVTGYGRVALFHNDGGQRFTDVSDQAGIRDASWATSAGWADLTGSGYPDLYVCHYCDWSPTNNPICKSPSFGRERDICAPSRFKPLIHAIFRNNGDGTFRDVAKELGLREDGYGLGVILADLTGAGRPSIYVTNDESNKHLYVNRQGKLEEKGLLAGVATDDNGGANGSMGVDVADYDGSGYPSIFVSNFQNEIHALYQNMGQERFSYQSYQAGTAALSRHFVGFGASFIDVDNDGWEDIIFVNGHVFRKPANSSVKQVPVLLRNVAARDHRMFQDWSKRGGEFFATPALGRGLAVGDLDNDGWPDLVVSNSNSPVVLLRNQASAGNPARWLGVKLVGKGNRDVTGSTVTLATDTRTLTRFSKGGGSYLSASDRRILFGLGTSGQPGRLSVKWAWGGVQHFDDLEPNSYWELREGEAKAKREQ